jgi:NADH-quinone oxidoreductase subunit F
VQAGVFGLPTVVHNVETLANVPHIILDGAAKFAEGGTEQSTDPKLFCLSGPVARHVQILQTDEHPDRAPN